MSYSNASYYNKRYPVANSFRKFFQEASEQLPKYRNHHTPAANVRKEGDGHVLELAVPGLDKDAIHIEVKEGKVLHIYAKSSEEPQEIEGSEVQEKQEYSRLEFDYEEFSSHFRLSESADTDAITAKYEQGVLYVSIPALKKEEPRTKKVNIA